jgi:ribosomal-protein-alanine N-acetyltransferase
MQVVETDRLILRHFTPDDAEFIRELLNEPGWKKYIGDRSINTLDDARTYIDKLRVSYRDFGFGLYAVELKESGALIGMCGLLKRETLDDVDVGFAMLEKFQGMGYAREAAQGTLDHARDGIGIRRVVAITTEDNEVSGRVLERIGMKYEGPITLGNETLRLFTVAF